MMSRQMNEYGGAARGSDVEETAFDTASAARENASEFGERGRHRADASIDAVADGVSRLASKLRERSPARGGVAVDASTRLADGMDKTAGYLRDHDSEQILGDVEHYVRQHPMQAIAGAVVGGFIIGRVLR